jgi:hypothetical protein
MNINPGIRPRRMKVVLEDDYRPLDHATSDVGRLGRGSTGSGRSPGSESLARICGTRSKLKNLEVQRSTFIITWKQVHSQHRSFRAADAL